MVYCWFLLQNEGRGVDVNQIGRNSEQSGKFDGQSWVFQVTGRTKGNQVSGSNFSFPCINVTTETDLNPGSWIRRLVEVWSKETDNSGRVFYRGITPTKMSHYEADFFDVLYKVQAN